MSTQARNGIFIVGKRLRLLAAFDSGLLHKKHCDGAWGAPTTVVGGEADAWRTRMLRLKESKGESVCGIEAGQDSLWVHMAGWVKSADCEGSEPFPLQIFRYAERAGLPATSSRPKYSGELNFLGT